MLMRLRAEGRGKAESRGFGHPNDSYESSAFLSIQTSFVVVYMDLGWFNPYGFGWSPTYWIFKNSHKVLRCLIHGAHPFWWLLCKNWQNCLRGLPDILLICITWRCVFKTLSCAFVWFKRGQIVISLLEHVNVNLQQLSILSVFLPASHLFSLSFKFFLSLFQLWVISVNTKKYVIAKFSHYMYCNFLLHNTSSTCGDLRFLKKSSIAFYLFTKCLSK